MPKFVWVGEITTRDLLKEKKSSGVVILDATEANIFDNKPLILGAFSNKIITFEPPGGMLSILDLAFNPFEIFQRNLRGI